MSRFPTSLPPTRRRRAGMLLRRLAMLVAFALLFSVPSGAPAHDEAGKDKSGKTKPDQTEAGKDEAGGKKQPKPSAIQWKLESSHSALTSRNGSFYLRMRVKAAKVNVEGRQPLNLAFVFDRSGSMDEDAKIGFVRQAGHLVVDNLTPQDYVSLIAYNHLVQTLVPMHPVVNREYLHHRVDEIHAEGNTNLSGGFLEGCAQLAKRKGKPGLHHLILLTDGLANRGVTDTDQLVALVKRYAQGGMTVTTVGVGSLYNEKLLGRMSEAGGGRYIYVDKPDQIPTAFKQELGALLSVVAQNAKIKIKLPPNVKAEKVFGFDEPQKPGVLEVPLGDLSSGDERVVLVRLRRDEKAASQSGETIDLHAVLTYDDIVETRRTETELSVHIEPASGIEPASDGNSQASPVLTYAQLAEAVDKISKAVSGMDRSLAAEVLKIRQQQFPALKKAAWASHDQDFVNKAYMFEHYARELEHLINEGALHEHSDARARLQKKMHYDRYLRQHHRHRH